MSDLTEDGRRIVEDLSNRHGFSVEAVTVIVTAVSAGYGSQAQFSHPEFGGMGQWSAGGMIMIGDMFNTALAGRVSALCQEASSILNERTLFAPPPQSQSQSQGGRGPSPSGFGASLFVRGGDGAWWPAELGAPGATGSQNNLRYAYFPAARRLAIEMAGATTVYDTGDHQIAGFSQQQSGDQSLTFTSNFGLVSVASLPVVGGDPGPVAHAPRHDPTAPAAPSAPESAAAMSSAAMSSEETLKLLEKLADLYSRGILTDAEFDAKKAELLARL